MSLLSRLATAAARSLGILSAKSNKVSADFLIVAGGGAGGYSANSYYKSGGGGAGGLRTSAGTSGGGASAESPLILSTLNTYTIVVGAGGVTAQAAFPSQASDSWISGTGINTTISYGGGSGGSAYAGGNGQIGGSGGGGFSSSYTSNTTYTGSAGITNQGYAGGTGYLTANTTMSWNSGGGGGGAGGVGGNGVNNTTGAGGNGGAGVTSTISGSSVSYAGGGGGGGYSTGGTATAGGGNGGNGTVGTAGTANTGGGGGGSAGATTAIGNNGGSGIVIISYTATAPKFVGGTITTSGGKQIHTFTSSGTLTPITEVPASYLVVAGGGGGGVYGGGGGAGGLLTGSTTLYSPATYIVTVGAGGTASSSRSSKGGAGVDSSITGTGLTTITSTGGGGGASDNNSSGQSAGNGGSGGGAAYASATSIGTGTSGQGNNGGQASNTFSTYGGGGGGGASAVGGNAASGTAGNGGNGTASSISGSSVTYAGGGGGGAQSSGTRGTGGTGGGGQGGNGSNYPVAGTANTGGGGGGDGAGSSSAAGGSGIVIISYAGSQKFNGGTITTSGGNTIHTFYATGALTPITATINNSLRFRSSATAYLSRTPSVASNRKTWTWSGWVKRGTLGSIKGLFGITSTLNPNYGYSNTYIGFEANDTFKILGASSTIGAPVVESTTTAVFRDPSAWYHVVVAMDTTQTTAANGVKLYINGVQQSLTSTAYTQNTDTFVNTTQQHLLGLERNSSGGSPLAYYYDGYLADVYFIDGQALEPYYFGSNDSNNIWKPIAYYGSYGTNGFHLPFVPNSSGFTGYYANFNGSNTQLKINDNAVFNPGTSDFCWEVMFNASSAGGNLFGKGGSVIYESILTTYNGSNGITCYISNPSNSYIVNGTYTFDTLVPDQWNHLAVYRNGANFFIAVNGQVKQVGNSIDAIIDNTGPFVIGGYSNSTSAVGTPPNGKMSNLRYVVGSSVYGPNNFTPPSSALTAITGTQLLTLQNSTFIDNSANVLTITDINSNTTTTSGTVANYGTISFDTSGNYNHWATSGISLTSGTTYDAMIDSPTNASASGTQPVGNYCTLNPLLRSYSSITNANTTMTTTGGAGSNQWTLASGGQFPTSGKWYFEVYINNKTADAGGSSIGIGLQSNQANTTYPLGNYLGQQTTGEYNYQAHGYTFFNNVQSGSPVWASYTTGDTIGVAYDLGSLTCYWYKNNTLQGSTSLLSGYGYAPAFSIYQASQATINCGQRPFTYTPPSGYQAICTTNLPDSTIVQGNKYMDATLYTGTGSNLSISTNNIDLSTNGLVWVKCRTAAENHFLFDSLRTTGAKYSYSLTSNDTTAEAASTAVTNPTTSSYTNASGGNPTNTSGRNYVQWLWQAGSSAASSNTSGSITSTTSVNATAGFSIVTYTGTGANGTVGHGLGVAPKMIIVKQRGGTTSWNVYHTSIGAGNLLYLEATNASTASSTTWNNTSPTSSVFSIGTAVGTNTNTGTYVAYCFAEISGFSKFGSYTGNGSADGPFVYTGFLPKFILWKNASGGTASWAIHDTSRSPYNTTITTLSPNTSAVEGSVGEIIDMLSNGFKIRSTDAWQNTSGSTYIYAAFAENPFKNSNAR